MSKLDTRELRNVLGAFVTGVTVITTVDEHGKPHGLTVNSFSSVSLDPPLVLWSQSLSAPSHPVFRDAERFVVNILAEDQPALSNRFARGGGDKFAGCAVRLGLGGVPLIEGCAAWLECKRVQSLPGGDHMVFLGEVERFERNARNPLVFGGGRYLVAEPHDLGQLDFATANIARLHAVRLANRTIVELSAETDQTVGLGVWGNHGPTIVRWEAAREPVSDNLRTGLVLPVLSSATGRVFGAWLPRELTAPFIQAELSATSADRPADFDDLSVGFDRIRRDGIAQVVGTERFVDIYGVRITALSVPVFDATGEMVLALTAIGAVDRLDAGVDASVSKALKSCAQSLTQRLSAATKFVNAT